QETLRHRRRTRQNVKRITPVSFGKHLTHRRIPINYQLKTINEFLQQLINGFSLGAIYALIALGYTMVYGVLRFINFAHGDVFMLGAFAGYYFGPKVTQIFGRGVAAGPDAGSMPLVDLLNPSAWIILL